MNYYERIQKSIDYIESKLEDNIEIEKVAQEAFMSCSNFYRMFFALTGYAVKEYIRHRRISSAVKYIKETNDSILAIALKYGFESNEALTRAFKRVTGYPPSAFRRNNLNYSFERVNILNKYYDIQDGELLEKYPDIKVLKELKPFRVAYYCYYGLEPENGAFSVMSDWLKRSGLSFEKDKLRIFGFNNPSPACPLNMLLQIINGLKSIYISMMYQFIDWVKMNKKYDFDNRPFMEEFIIDSPALKSTTRVKHFMPVRSK